MNANKKRSRAEGAREQREKSGKVGADKGDWQERDRERKVKRIGKVKESGQREKGRRMKRRRKMEVRRKKR